MIFRFIEKIFKMKKILIITSILLIALIVIAANPISFSKDKHIIEKGTISKIYKGGNNDIVIKLENNQNTFYINRGFEKFKSENIKKLTTKNVSITYSDGFTPLDLDNNRSKSIEKLEIENKIFYSE